MVPTSVVDPTGPTTVVTDCFCCRTVPLLGGGGEMMIVVIIIMISVWWTLFVVLIPGLGAPMLSIGSDTTLGGAGDVTAGEVGVCALRTCRERLTHGRDQPFNTFCQHFRPLRVLVCRVFWGESTWCALTTLQRGVTTRGVNFTMCRVGHSRPSVFWPRRGGCLRGNIVRPTQAVRQCL